MSDALESRTTEVTSTPDKYGTADRNSCTPSAGDNSTVLGNRLSEIDAIRANSVRYLDSKEFPGEYKAINDLADYLKAQTDRYADATNDCDFTEVGSYFINDFFAKSILPLLANKRIDSGGKSSVRQLADMSDAMVKAFFQAGVKSERQSAVKLVKLVSEKLLRSLDFQGQEKRCNLAKNLVKRVSEQIAAIETMICKPHRQKINQTLIRAFPRRSANKLMQCEGDAHQLVVSLLAASEYLAVILGEGTDGEDYQEKLRDFRYDEKLLNFLRVDILSEEVPLSQELAGTLGDSSKDVMTITAQGSAPVTLTKRVCGITGDFQCACYSEVFGKNEPSLSGMDDYLEKLTKESPEEDEREWLVELVNYVCEKEGWHLMYVPKDGISEPEPCNLNVKETSERNGKTKFRARRISGKQEDLGTPRKFPRLTVNRAFSL